jgi:hypothetical protein
MNKIDNNLSKRQKAFLERLAQARSDLLAVIDGLEVRTLTTEPVMGDWTVKDILGHLVSWNEEFRSNIEVILAGKHPGYDHQISEENDFSDSNQLWITQKRGWTYERIRADLDHDYEEAVSLILNLQPSGFRKRGVTPWKTAAIERPEKLTKADTDSVETLVTYHWRHMNMHIRHLKAWRKNRENRQ